MYTEVPRTSCTTGKNPASAQELVVLRKRLIFAQFATSAVQKFSDWTISTDDKHSGKLYIYPKNSQKLLVETIVTFPASALFKYL